MNAATRPPPAVLLVHNGHPYEAHIKHLTDSGLHVSETHADTALTDAIRIQPDIVVLDFGCDGEVTAQLKGHAATKHISIIALLELTRQS
jgi:DNA-binding response OmpR family regulator